MSPSAFYDLAEQLHTTSKFKQYSITAIQKRLAVALTQLGRFGTGGGIKTIAEICGCCEGTVVIYTNQVVDGLNEMSDKVVCWATEQEHQAAKDWVAEQSGAPQWASGWAIVDGVHIPLQFKPCINHWQYYNYKGYYSMNVQLVMLPNTLQIIECIVGLPGSAQDSRAWAADSKVLCKPRLYLDKGDFIWTDSGYAFSPFSLSPYSDSLARKSYDL